MSDWVWFAPRARHARNVECAVSRGRLRSRAAATHCRAHHRRVIVAASGGEGRDINTPSARAPRAAPASPRSVISAPGPPPQHGMPAPAKVRVGIISRRRKRFILNEDELVRAVLALGFEVQILPLEEMTLYEQVWSSVTWQVRIASLNH